MIITELAFDLGLITGSVPLTGPVTRSTGLHVTEIIHSLESTFVTRDEMEERQLEHYRKTGFIWEKMIERGMVDSVEYGGYVRPGEVRLDGIAGSPDLLDLVSSTVVDTKCTWRSSNKVADLQRNFWTWTVQLKSYCHMVDWHVAELWILFVCGNWKPPVPELKRIQLTFTKAELNDNWHMLTQHAKEKGML